MEISRKLKGGKMVRHPRSVSYRISSWIDNRVEQRYDDYMERCQNVGDMGRW